MEVDLSISSEMLSNLEDIINDLTTIRFKNIALLNFDFLTKIHSLKHQLLTHNEKELAKITYELEKIAMRLVKENIHVSSSQVNMMLDIFQNIYENLITHNTANYVDYYQNILNKLLSINLLREKAYSDNDCFVNRISTNNSKQKRVNLVFQISFLEEFLNSVEKIQNHIYLDEIERSTLLNLFYNFQSKLSSFRYEHISLLTKKMNIIAKSIAADCGKAVKLHINAQDCTIDRVVLDLLIDPISQIIKNNIVHGFESLEERKSQNKTSYGNLYLNFYEVDNYLHIEIINDGRPIDFKKLIKRFKNENVKIEEDNLNDLLFTPFVSANEKPDINSGSGIGLVGVKACIDSLGGKIDVISNDELTMFTIIVPSGFIYSSYNVFKVRGLYFAIPTKLTKTINSTSQVFDYDILDFREIKNDHDNIIDKSFLLNNKLIISDFIIRYYLISNKLIVPINKVIAGTCNYNNRVIIILNSDYSFKLIKKMADTDNCFKIVFKDKDNNYAKINVNDIIEIKTCNNHLNPSPCLCEVTYLDNNEILVRKFKEVIDLILN